jgi:3-deoxy-D-manno-octulosonic-acid transferase
VIAEDHLRKIYNLIEDRKVVRYSQSTVDNVSDAEIMIIDCFGLLSSIYKYATVSYVGGGFGVGIHNTLEAAVWNIPVIFGPNNKKFQEAQGLLRHGGGFEIIDFDAFCHVMKAFESESTLKQASEQAGKYVESLSGATHKILSYIKL